MWRDSEKAIGLDDGETKRERKEVIIKNEKRKRIAVKIKNGEIK